MGCCFAISPYIIIVLCIPTSILQIVHMYYLETLQMFLLLLSLIYSAPLYALEKNFSDATKNRYCDVYRKSTTATAMCTQKSTDVTFLCTPEINKRYIYVAPKINGRILTQHRYVPTKHYHVKSCSNSNA